MNAYLGPKIGILSHIMRRRIDQIAEDHGLSGPQSRILHYIAVESQKREVFQRDVENAFHIRRSSVTSLVQHLEKNQLIERVSVKRDARLKKLVLSQKGQKVQEEIGKRIIDFEESLLGLLKENKEDFIHQLNELIEVLVEQEMKKEEEGNDD